MAFSLVPWMPYIEHMSKVITKVGNKEELSI